MAAGLVNAAGEITHQMRTPMAAHDAVGGLAAVIRAINSVRCASKTDAEKISGIGICAPGPLDPRTGVVINPPNLPGWRNFPLAAEVEKICSLPVRVDNDGNAAALAEALWGAGRGFRNVFCATIGTGIGTGIVFDGRIYHGRTGAAAAGLTDHGSRGAALIVLGCLRPARTGGRRPTRRVLYRGDCGVVSAGRVPGGFHVPVRPIFTSGSDILGCPFPCAHPAVLVLRSGRRDGHVVWVSCR